MKLLVVESPSKAKTIGKYLGKNFKVLSSYGHVRGLPSEKGAVAPEDNFKMRYEVQPRAGKHIKEITAAAKKSEFIYLATDPDREGEAISWHIAQLLEQNKAANAALKRVVFYEITEKAIKEALESPRDLDMSLVHAQQARQALDYLVGFTLSPILWRKLPGSRSAGRVQSVALRLVCDRETEIEKFKSQEYWSIGGCFNNVRHGDFNSQLSYFHHKLEKLSITNQEQANDIVKQLKNKTYFIYSVEKKQKKRNPLPPFTTSTMLQEASKKFGFTARRTAQVAQTLYEGINIAGETKGLITYMRTDSTNISKDAQQSILDLVSSEYGAQYIPKSKRQYKTKTRNAQEAHEAIRPTQVSLKPQNIKEYLKPEQYKLYDLIWKRAVASQMTSAIFDMMSIQIASEDKAAYFKASGSKLVFDGHYKVYKETIEEKEEQSQDLPDLHQGENVTLKKLNPEQHFTQPPPRYSEASLVKKMEEVGVGRPSTYPAIISILQEREYVTLEKKRFIPEPRGRVVSTFLQQFFTKYVDNNFTASLEEDLDNVSNGKKDWKLLLKEFWDPFQARADEVSLIKNQDVVREIEKLILHNDSKENSAKCPGCKNGALELKVGKFGAFIGCSNYPECKHTHTLIAAKTEDKEKSHFPIELGQDTKSDEAICIKKGPYGVYLQRGEGKQAKRTALPKGLDASNITLEHAVALLELPKEIGTHPEDGGLIKTGIGRYGPYVHYNNKYYKSTKYNPIHITLQQALEIITEYKVKKKK